MPQQNPLSSSPLAAFAPLAQSIVLVGLMGAGKSCIGRRLSAVLGIRFVDADDEIEAAAGCSIPDIFARHGEAEFRSGERRVIARLLGGEPIVLATGGGAFMDTETRALIARTAVSLWLRASLDTLVKRTARRDDRPLLAGRDARAVLAQLMAEREPTYGLADVVVDSSEGRPEVTVERVLAALAAHFAGLEPSR